MLGIIPYGTNEDYPRQRFPFVTAALVIINVAVFAYMVVLSSSDGVTALNDFVSRFAVIPAYVTAGNWFSPTLVTSMFLHGGLVHLGSNLLFLMAFGDNVEDRFGHWRYLGLYLLWGIIGAYTHVFFNTGSTLPTVGASGAIAGVLGAYLILFPRGNVKTFFFFVIFFTLTRIPAILVIGSWFVMQLFTGLGSLGATTAETGGVAVWAHIGGFIAGVITVLLLQPPAPQHPSQAQHDR